jgi:hypothetical protein
LVHGNSINEKKRFSDRTANYIALHKGERDFVPKRECEVTIAFFKLGEKKENVFQILILYADQPYPKICLQQALRAFTKPPKLKFMYASYRI